MSEEKYRNTDITAYLTSSERADPAAARRAGTEIADAWNRREFWLSATAEPLRWCALRSPGMSCDGKAVLDRLQRHFGTHVHDVPAWEPNRKDAA